jgi:hypothetical protein
VQVSSGSWAARCTESSKRAGRQRQPGKGGGDEKGKPLFRHAAMVSGCEGDGPVRSLGEGRATVL